MLKSNNDLLYSSQNIKLRSKQNSKKYNDLPRGKSVKNSLILKDEFNEIISSNEINDNNLKLSIDKFINDLLNTDNNLKHNYADHNKNYENKNRNYVMEAYNSKFRINTDVEKINNKLFDNSHKNDDSLLIDKPYYYNHVLNKKNINNLRSYLNYKNIENYPLNNISIKKNKRKNMKTLDDLDIKDLQKLYYDIDQIELPKIENNYQKNKSQEKNTRYIYENYASNKNIFNHPKLYVLENNERKFPKIKSKLNEMSIKLDYEKKKLDKLKFIKLYFGALNKT
jgi:hypothetical protein